MKNIQGNYKDLEIYNKDGKVIYKYYKTPSGFYFEHTYNDEGNQLTYKSSSGYWSERTYDDKGNQLTLKDSDGCWFESTYDDKGNELTYKDSDWNCYERTYDDKGNELTYKNSNGTTRGFDIPEYTMEELVQKLGNFKIKL